MNPEFNQWLCQQRFSPRNTFDHAKNWTRSKIMRNFIDKKMLQQHIPIPLRFFNARTPKKRNNNKGEETKWEPGSSECTEAYLKSIIEWNLHLIQAHNSCTMDKKKTGTENKTSQWLLECGSEFAFGFTAHCINISSRNNLMLCGRSSAT